MALNASVTDEGKKCHDSSDHHQWNAYKRRIALCWQHCLFFQRKGKLPDKQGEFDHNKAKAHNGNAGPDPGQECSLICQVIAWGRCFASLFTFFHCFCKGCLYRPLQSFIKRKTTLHRCIKITLELPHCFGCKGGCCQFCLFKGNAKHFTSGIGSNGKL